MNFGQSQGSALRHNVLKRIASGAKSVLEIGSYEGGSALAMAEAMAEGGHIYCVDVWKPYLHEDSVNGSSAAGEMMEDLKRGVVFERFKENIKESRIPISYFKGSIQQAYPIIPYNLFDLVFVDGCHLYQQVMVDLLYSAAVLKVGGVLCGDDLEYQGDIELREEDENREYNGSYHPGVTKAVWAFFKGKVWSEEGVWVMRKVPGGWENWK